ncbi:hypothetical protein ABZZ79_10445 [Streptomyces sp. NPDC006458]|uniref:hypothetical protein n=1 Tax=Streptomyces sp. NPDC006458 TaxID=3154302 RepID=UPI0033AC7869
MTPSAVAVTGSGLAELTCARLLAGRGHRVRLAPEAPAAAAGPRPLLLNGPTLELLRSLWGDGLLDGTWGLTEREVVWGAAAPARFPQPAVVVEGVRLAARIRARLEARTPPPGRTEWTVTARPPDESHRTHGRRTLLAGTAPLAAGQDQRTARLATARLGWVHLTPLGDGQCLAQAMVPGPAAEPAALLARLLDESGLGHVPRQPPDAAVAVPAAPRLHPAPARPPSDGTGGVLTVGAGALRCDPLSGTGTAQALRTGILAAAVIDAASKGTPADALCAHYAERLRAAFHEHLRSCALLYAPAFPDPAWRDEIAAARPGEPVHRAAVPTTAVSPVAITGAITETRPPG